MNISKINNITTFKSNYKDTFRDNELFDESRDEVSNGYSSYDGYDVSTSDLVDDVIDYKYPNSYDVRIPEKNRALNAVYGYHDVNNNFDNNIQESFSVDDEVYKLCTLHKKSGDKFSGNLYNHICKKLEKYPIEDIAAVCGASKLKKADSTEYMDYDVFNTGFYLLDNLDDENKQCIPQILKALVEKDENGNEVFILNKRDFLHIHMHESDNFNAQKCLKLFNLGNIYDENGIYKDFDMNEAYNKLEQE